MKFLIPSLTAGCFLLASVLFTSCQKENDVQSQAIGEEESHIMTGESAAADAEYDEVTEIGLTAAADIEASNSAPEEVPGTAAGTVVKIRTEIFKELASKLGPCTEITVSSDSFPKTVIINYGDGCVCRDGKFRKGAVVLHFTGPIRRSGSVLTITFRDYYVNRAHIEGTKRITNLSAGTMHKFSVNVEEGKISWDNGRGFHYEGRKVILQKKGADTRTVADDVYEITGDDKTIYANGGIVVKNTETPLIKIIGCKWLVQGKLKILINNRSLFIDYGTGDCDNKATLSWSRGKKEITLD